MRPLLLSTLVFAALGLALARAGEGDNTLTAQEKSEGWKLLFDGKSLDQWRVYNKDATAGWGVRDGSIVLEKTGSGDLMTRDKFGDFEFSLDWKFDNDNKNNNSGIIYRVAETKGPAWKTGPEMQIMPDTGAKQPGLHDAGSFYDLFPPTSNAMKPWTEWNRFKVVARGKHFEQYVNGTKVIDIDMGSDAWKAAMEKSKFKKVPEFASQSEGHIALQDHGAKIAFRNVKVRVLK
jgi:hypothetical protein